MGLCIFGRSVTNVNFDFLAEAINHVLGTNLKSPFFEAIGRETLKLEQTFNQVAGFTVEDDELPAFFYNEKVERTGRVARFHGSDVQNIYDKL